MAKRRLRQRPPKKFSDGRYVGDYTVAHIRVARARGKAATHVCVDCGDTAKEWSYNHSGVDEVVTKASRWHPALAYSTDVDQYDPRCTPCHFKFDAPYGRTKPKPRPAPMRKRKVALDVDAILAAAEVPGATSDDLWRAGRSDA